MKKAIEQRNRAPASPVASTVAWALAGVTMLTAACTSDTRPATPTPPPGSATASVYILPGAADLGRNAFGDHPVVIHRGERMQWRNADGVEHHVVSDTTSLPEFTTTGTLALGSERSFVMNTLGTTPIHCSIHPQMVGTLIVQEP